MKRSIQKRFFAWLILHTLIVFTTFGLAVIVYNAYEVYHKPHGSMEHRADDEEEGRDRFAALFGDEAEESLFLLGILVLMLPLSFICAWYISKRLLRPWSQLNKQARRISTGDLEERIAIENIDDEMGQLACSLNAAFDRYQGLLDRMRRFSFDISHQMRNPLAAIQTTGEVCLAASRTPEEYAETLGDILESTRRLRRTTDQLLMLACAAGAPQNGQMDCITLQDVAPAVMKEALIIGDIRNVQVQLEMPEEPIQIRGVPELLQSGLSNLVDNALRHSPDGGRVVIRFIQPSPEFVHITVQDDGPGLSPDQLKNLFQPFSRNPRVHKESVGLGLTIVSDICKAHGGKVTTENLRPRGCLFRMELPVSHFAEEPLKCRTGLGSCR